MKKKKNFTKNKNQTEIPISKTDQSGAALFEVEFIAWRLAQSRLPLTIPTPRRPRRTEAEYSAKLNLKNTLPDDAFRNSNYRCLLVKKT